MLDFNKSKKENLTQQNRIKNYKKDIQQTIALPTNRIASEYNYRIEFEPTDIEDRFYIAFSTSRFEKVDYEDKISSVIHDKSYIELCILYDFNKEEITKKLFVNIHYKRIESLLENGLIGYNQLLRKVKWQ